MVVLAQIDFGEMVGVTAAGCAVGLTACISGMANRWFVIPWFLLVGFFDFSVARVWCRDLLSESAWDVPLMVLALLGWNLPSVAAWFVCSWYDRKQTRETNQRLGLCPGCGYNLTGNVSGICPECGERLSADSGAGGLGLAVNSGSRNGLMEVEEMEPCSRREADRAVGREELAVVRWTVGIVGGLIVFVVVAGFLRFCWDTVFSGCGVAFGIAGLILPHAIALYCGYHSFRRSVWPHKPEPPPGHCRKCGYNLTGNVSGICPECGERLNADSGAGGLGLAVNSGSRNGLMEVEEMEPCSRREADRAVGREDIARGLREVGLKAGDVVLVHSAMRTFGRVEGGADTVVGALLDVLGDTGTLVAPTFTFAHEAEPDPVIDPANDPSEMGIISETVRRHPSARRSTAYRHSFAAIGPKAEAVCGVDPALSSFDLRSSFGVMLTLDAQVLLLGMTYASSTSHHFAEWVCEVPYRHRVPRSVKVRRADGTVVPQAMVDYQPKPSGTASYYGTRKTDFNRLGLMLEERGRVGIVAIGNAVVRRFGMRDLIDLARIEAAKDCNVFRTDEGKTGLMDFTPLPFGRIVLSPEMKDGAGRPNHYQWCVVDETRLQMPEA